MLAYKSARQKGLASGVSSQRIQRLEKRGMTDIYVELGGKKAIAWSLEWPGWCRIRTSAATAVQALIDTEARYRLIAQRVGLSLPLAISWWSNASQAMPTRPGECLRVWLLPKPD